MKMWMDETERPLAEQKLTIYRTLPMTDKQTVVDDPKTAAKPAVTGNGAQDDAVDPLEKLLAEYDQGIKTEPAVTQHETKPAPQPAADPEFANRIARMEQRLMQEDINGAVKNIVGDLKIPHRLAVGWLDQMAREQPGVLRAFMNKSTDPKTWARMEKSLNKELAKELGSADVIDHDATVDRAAVTAAVRGASTKVAPEPEPELGRMSDAELRNWRMQKYGF